MPPLAHLQAQRIASRSKGLLAIEAGTSSNSAKGKQKQRAWKVVHACESAREVLPLVEGQVAIGMRPFLLTPSGSGFAPAFREHPNQIPAKISLLQTWNHVRDWRRLLNESHSESAADVIHAHSFAAGMAAVRASSGVVYQLEQPIEKLAAAAGHCQEDSWLARSFHVAEQFVLARSAAVVVSNHTARLACMERGVRAENLFLIPEPVDSAFLESVPNREWMLNAAGAGPESVFFLIPGLARATAWECRDSLLRWMRVVSVVRQDNQDARFAFLCPPEQAGAVRQLASACNLLPWICVLPPEVRGQAMASADVVICDAAHVTGKFALEALARGRALLAGDVEQQRDITSDGRGCLWFRSGEVGDISLRARFLAGNAQFRRALGAAGREHCALTRSAEVVASQYDAVYRLAFSKRKDRDGSPPKPQLIPLEVSG